MNHLYLCGNEAAGLNGSTRESLERGEDQSSAGNEDRALSDAAERPVDVKIEKHCSLFSKMEATGGLSNSSLGEC